MANYKVPRAFAILSDLPRNAAGKVLKTELRSPLPRPLD
jgi:acyl-CoA synthetase (AMP-forming)/AMP-acid ligase II